MTNKNSTKTQLVMEKELIKIIELLKPCPFCGRMPKIETCEGHNWEGKQKHVNIGACYELWVISCPDDGCYCEVSPHTAWYPALTSAVVAWNTRVKDKKC